VPKERKGLARKGLLKEETVSILKVSRKRAHKKRDRPEITGKHRSERDRDSEGRKEGCIRGHEEGNYERSHPSGTKRLFGYNQCQKAEEKRKVNSGEKAEKGVVLKWILPLLGAH